MSVSELKLIKRCVEFCAKAEIRKIPWKTRGLHPAQQEGKGRIRCRVYRYGTGSEVRNA